MSMRIRVAEPQDAADIVRVLQGLRKFPADKALPAQVAMGSCPRVTVVAEIDGRIAAVASRLVIPHFWGISTRLEDVSRDPDLPRELRGWHSGRAAAHAVMEYQVSRMFDPWLLTPEQAKPYRDYLNAEDPNAPDYPPDKPNLEQIYGESGWRRRPELMIMSRDSVG